MNIEVIHTTPADETTYNSSNIHSVCYVDDADEYLRGKLIVRFRQNSANADDEPRKPHSEYIYDIGREVFEKFQEKASKSIQTRETAGEWYNDGFANEFPRDERLSEGPLYVKKRTL